MKLDVEKLSCFLLKVRFENGYSQANMATMLGITQKAYSYIEAGKTKLKICRFLQIAQILKVHPMEIINYSVSTDAFWLKDHKKEDSLENKVGQMLESMQSYQSQNNFLRETINKLLDRA